MLFALCAVWPANAHAQSDIIDWLQQGSGPGPYKSYKGYELRVFCLPTGVGIMDTAKRKVWNCLLDDPDRTRAVLSFGTNWASTENTRLFIDDPSDVREVKERRWTTAFTYRMSSLLSVGGTLDFMQFKSDQGNAFSFWRVGIGPRLIFTPCGKCTATNPPSRSSSAGQFLHLQLDATYVPQGLKASDFGNTVSKYDPGASFQVRTSLVLDGAVILRAIHP
jgi:hypothetical protein